MITRRTSFGLVLALCCLLTSTILMSGGCASTQTGATPLATAALKADAIVIRVNELQAVVIEACGPTRECQPGSLPTQTAVSIVQACIDARRVLRAAPSGWQATVKAGWAQARPRFGVITNPAVNAALAAVDVLLGSL